MAVRSDVIVDWSLSPRIITVLSPSTQIAIQDLHDTLVVEEAKWTGMDEPRIVSTAGKEPLGGGVLVGLTMTLLNAKLAFEARPGPTTVQVNVGGGNLVAQDEFLANIDPIEPTAFTQVVRTSSSSATLLEAEQLEAATFQGVVTIDVVDGVSGTTFPIGTRGAPSNNLADARLISEDRGLNAFAIAASMTFSSEDFSDGRTFIGDNIATITVVLDPSANISNCTFENMTIEGTLDGGNILRRCRLQNVTAIQSGGVHDCAVGGMVNITGGVKSSWFDCWSDNAGLDIGDYPIFDMGGSGNNLVIRGWSGGIGIQNVTSGTDESSLDFESGRAVFDSTVAAGRFGVRGVADVIDDSTGTAVVTDNTVNGKLQELIKAHFNKMVTDPVAGTVTVYDDDDVTVLRTAPLKEDAAGTQPYRGQGAERRERMT